MTQHTTETAKPDPDPAASDTTAMVDIGRLARALFEKAAAAQRDLMRARAAEDAPAADQWLLCLRASALLLACLPTHPDSEGHRLKVLAAAMLREEDGAEGSHAWPMIEQALRLDRQSHETTAALG